MISHLGYPNAILTTGSKSQCSKSIKKTSTSKSLSITGKECNNFEVRHNQKEVYKMKTWIFFMKNLEWITKRWWKRTEKQSGENGIRQIKAIVLWRAGLPLPEIGQNRRQIPWRKQEWKLTLSDIYVHMLPKQSYFIIKWSKDIKTECFLQVTYRDPIPMKCS